jgi:hypothetical protein
MNDATDRSYSEKPVPEERAESEIGSVAEKEVKYEGERIKTSVALLTSKSIKELEGLTFELKGLQEFLKSETERVQREVDNALSGVKVAFRPLALWRRKGRLVATRAARLCTVHGQSRMFRMSSRGGAIGLIYRWSIPRHWPRLLEHNGP